MFLFGSLAGVLPAQVSPVQPLGSQIPGPAQAGAGQDWYSNMTNWQRDTAGAFDGWIEDLRIWRQEHLIRMGYDDAEYRRPALLWTERNFVQPQAMVEERYFYDPVERRYTVGRYLDDVERRYGGIDSILLWPVYPNIGIDNRNQWDLARDMPGGISALRQMIDDFHQRGVRVFFPTMPWDNGTRDPGMPHWEATAKLMAEIGADGVNGDTFTGVPRAYRLASDATGHPVAFEPESPPEEDGALAYNNQSWAYWNYPLVPMVSKLKWLEPRHMIHVCNRGARDHTDDLQAAFFNGVGFESWENVWGIWNQMTPRDGEALRRISHIYRSFPDLPVSMEWTPHVPTLRYGVYASMFPGRGRTLWTIVNRSELHIAEDAISVAHVPGRRYFDLWSGTEATSRIVGDRAIIRLDLEPHGYGAVLAIDSGVEVDGLAAVLARMHEWAAKPLQSYSKEWAFLPQQLVPIAPTAPASAAPPGMVAIPAGEFDFHVIGVEIEGGGAIGLDMQYPWEDSPRREHRRSMAIHAFFIDTYPVTNAEFKKFIDATHYHPADNHNFLRHWVDGAPRPGQENIPVTWVSIEDARTYAKWAGKRLPHEWEWQYAAQGTDGRLYPWGNQWDGAAVPAPYKGRDLPPASAVDAHPQGKSPFGVQDLTGNVWQWTDEYVDEHTRAAVLRGGSYYQPQHSIWYFPQAYKLTEHAKYLLMAPSKDRAGTLGFRCAVDTP
jgi:formylglycine-generating enzyme required for sulfatase activity